MPKASKPIWILSLSFIGFVLLIIGYRYLFPPPDRTWQAIEERGSWRVGLDPSFPPFEMLDADGKPIGFDVDLAEQMAKAWGVRLEIVAISFDGLSDALLVGKIDSIVSALPYDPRGTQDFAYSPPYFDAGIRVVVQKDAPIEAIDELDGHKVAVEWGSMGDMVGRQLQGEGIAIELVRFDTSQEAVTALIEDNTIEGLLIDTITLRQAQGEGKTLKAIGDMLESNPYVIASPLTATILNEKISQTLLELSESGHLAELETKWLIEPNGSR